MVDRDRRYDDFDIVPVVEDFITSGAIIRPEALRVAVPVVNEQGEATVEISDVVEDPENAGVFLASAVLFRRGRRRRGYVSANDLSIDRNNNQITVGSELSFDPDSEHSVIRSKKLWVALGVVSVGLAGIGVTRRVMRARKK